MIRRLAIIFVFFTGVSAAYAEGNEFNDYVTCDAGCYGLCGLEGISQAKCKRICGC